LDFVRGGTIAAGCFLSRVILLVVSRPLGSAANEVIRRTRNDKRDSVFRTKYPVFLRNFDLFHYLMKKEKMDKLAYRGSPHRRAVLSKPAETA
jgi:hypothetical protein